MLKNKKISILSQGLKYRLKVAFCLMSVLPILVLLYLVSNYILPYIGLKLDITLSIFISILIAAIGFILIKEIFDSVLSVTSEAKLIAEGDIYRKFELEREDEIGSLGKALNKLTERIRNNMDELKSYGERTTEINTEIQRRVIMLSSLLQISSLISQGEKLDEIFSVIVAKSRLMTDSDMSYLLFREEVSDAFYVKMADGVDSHGLLDIRIEPSDMLYNKLTKTSKPLILDKQSLLPADIREYFYIKFKLKNTLMIPIYLKGKIATVLGVGNNKEQFLFKKEDIELIDVFGKQIAIAIENDILIHRMKKLEIKDSLTGLYNETFMHSRLNEEIKRAIIYQRPCGLIILNIDNFQKFQQNFGSLQSEAVLKNFASIINDSISEIDRAARIGDNDFAIILPERSKRQSQEIAENIRKRIEFIFGREQDINKRLTVSAGVSENPLDGIDADQLIRKAKELVGIAKTEGKNRVIGIN